MMDVHRGEPHVARGRRLREEVEEHRGIKPAREAHANAFPVAHASVETLGHVLLRVGGLYSATSLNLPNATSRSWRRSRSASTPRSCRPRRLSWIAFFRFFAL